MQIESNGFVFPCCLGVLAVASVFAMTLNNVEIADTFAEAFPMTAARAIVTADTAHWAEIAGRTMSGYATSVIACDAEASIERTLSPEETPDGRPGVSVLV